MNVENGLRLIGEARREVGRKSMVDAALVVAATRIVDRMEAAEEFGPTVHSLGWLQSKALDLAECLEGTLEDWQYAEAKKL